MNSEMSSLIPRWNLPIDFDRESESRDPLGFQRYAQYFADSLLHNFTVLTRRARYYSFIAWALSEIARYAEPFHLAGESLPFDQYTELVARFERFLAMAEAVWHGDESTDCAWVGIRSSKNWAKKDVSRLPLDTPMTKQEGSLGVLADYRQSMLSVGLLSGEKGHIPDMLTEEGQDLANAFREAIKFAKAKRWSNVCMDQEMTALKRADLWEAGKWMCLSNISYLEKRLLRRVLLEGVHASMVHEVRQHLVGRRPKSEGQILQIYLNNRAKNGIALTLKQAACYQVLSLACLSLFNGILVSFSDETQHIRIIEFVKSQLKKEGVKPSSSPSDLIGNVNVLKEIQSIERRRNEEPDNWMTASVRLLFWVFSKFNSEKELVISDKMGGVEYETIEPLFGSSNRKVNELIESLLLALLDCHYSVFKDKRKKTWINLEGKVAFCDENVSELRLNFPPNTIRLGSLSSIFRDLEVRHG